MEQWTASQTIPGVWVFTWTPAPAAVYEVWRNGLLLATTEEGVGTYTTDDGGPTEAPPVIEVHNTADGKADNEEYPPYALLQWRGIPECSAYKVEYFSGGGWRTVAQIREEGSGWYMYRSVALSDQETASFRVTALDIRGIGGTALPFKFTPVCNPGRPSASLLASGGTLTVEVG